MSEKAFWDFKEAAAFLNVPPSWVRDATRDGRLPHRTFGRYKRYVRAELEAWAEKQRNGSRVA